MGFFGLNDLKNYLFPCLNSVFLFEKNDVNVIVINLPDETLSLHLRPITMMIMYFVGSEGSLTRSVLLVVARVGPDIRPFSISGRLPDIETIRISGRFLLPDIRLFAGYRAFARYPAGYRIPGIRPKKYPAQPYLYLY